MSAAAVKFSAKEKSSVQALSMGVHESQSLLWERMVALSLPFSRYLAPRLSAAFPQLGELQVNTLTEKVAPALQAWSASG
jgi:Zn-dependent M32 family carboxypeptidase